MLLTYTEMTRRCVVQGVSKQEVVIEAEPCQHQAFSRSLCCITIVDFVSMTVVKVLEKHWCLQLDNNQED